MVSVGQSWGNGQQGLGNLRQKTLKAQAHLQLGLA